MAVTHSLKPLALLLLAGVALPVSAQRANQSDYVGSNTCEECHKQGYRRFASTKMAKVFFEAPRNELEAKGCEACHGAGREHVEAARAHDVAREKGVTYQGPRSGDFIIRLGKGSPLSMQEQSARCLQCHEKGQRLFWQGSGHEARGLGCGTCHQVHQNQPAVVAAAAFKEPLTTNTLFTKRTQMEVCFGCHPMRRAQLQRSSHMPLREGEMTCANCHNPHGGPNPKMLVAATVNETCYKCHPERRGPFLWEHPPVMENCSTCHEPHGSARPQLLKLNPPRLCQECHASTGHPSAPQLATSHYVFNRGCTNCHSQIHGSNHPAGSRFQR
jgi:DmsE family decaheme c-type cytochrome